MPANVDGMVREGISEYRAGRKNEARALLLRATEIDQYNEQAWLWLSAVVESPEEQRTCLENVLTINPANERAKQGLSILSQKGSGSAAARAQVDKQAEDILASASFTQPPPKRAAPDSDDELPTSIEWGASAETPVTASSSSSMNYRVNEPSKEEYDDWVSNLNLGGGASPSTANPFSMGDPFTPNAGPDPFGAQDNLFDDDTSLAPPGDIFSDGPFSAPEPEPPPLPSKPAPPPPAPSRPVTSPPQPAASSASPLSRRTGGAPPKPADEDDLDLLDDLGVDTSELLGPEYSDDLDDLELDRPEDDELFQYIPKEIRATRLPGTREGYPVLVVLGLLLGLLLNAGAVAWFVSRLTAA